MPRIGKIGKLQTQMPEGWIGVPETFVSPKIRQAGIDAHARSGSNDERIGRANPIGGLVDQRGRQVGWWRMHVRLISA